MEEPANSVSNKSLATANMAFSMGTTVARRKPASTLSCRAKSVQATVATTKAAAEMGCSRRKPNSGVIREMKMMASVERKAAAMAANA
ncbi:hypothetical protein D9M72_446860 [compost metagenome]